MVIDWCLLGTWNPCCFSILFPYRCCITFIIYCTILQRNTWELVCCCGIFTTQNNFFKGIQLNSIQFPWIHKDIQNAWKIPNPKPLQTLYKKSSQLVHDISGTSPKVPNVGDLQGTVRGQIQIHDLMKKNFLEAIVLVLHIYSCFLQEEQTFKKSKRGSPLEV